jgi:hypothetical protein
VKLPAFTKISGGSRSNKTLWYPNNPHCTFGSPTSPYPCPTANYRFCDGWEAEPCVKYTGDAGTVQIERMPASMTYTVDSGGAPIMTGSSVTFKVRASTDTMGGNITPVVIDTAAWTPDPDSTGGDYTEKKTTGACTVANVATGGKNCTRTMIGSGTIRIVAHINGKGYELTHHLVVSDAFVKLTPPLDSVFPFAAPTLDSTRFTASMSDGSAVNIVYPRWVFTADVGAGTTSFNCAFPIKNPCAVAVRDNGYMSVTVLYKGVEKHARARVTLRNRFELSVDPGTVARWNFVTFTATLNGQPVAPARWRWKPDTVMYDSIAGCGAESKCHREMIDSGEMWAYLSSSGGDSARARVSIVEPCAGGGASSGGASRASASLSCSGEGEGSAEAEAEVKVYLTIQADNGLDAYPSPGLHLVPLKSAVHYGFHAPIGARMSVSIDSGAWSPLAQGMDGVVRMTTPHTVRAILVYDCSGGATPDQRDSLIAQYRDTTLYLPNRFLNFDGAGDLPMPDRIAATYIPTCADFTSDRATPLNWFTWTDLRDGNKTGGQYDYSVALVQPPMLVDTSTHRGPEYWEYKYGTPLIVTSAYRTPIHQSCLLEDGVCTKGVRGSSHMRGIAIDADVVSCNVKTCGDTVAVPADTVVRKEHRAMAAAADSAKASFIEPTTAPFPCLWRCVHADWRWWMAWR